MAGTNQKELLEKLNGVLGLADQGLVRLTDDRIEVIRNGEYTEASMHNGYVRVTGTNDTRFHEKIIRLALDNRPRVGLFTEGHLVDLWLDGKISTGKAHWDNDETILLTLYGLYCREQSLQPNMMKKEKGSPAYKVYHACIKGKRKDYAEYLEDLLKRLKEEGKVDLTFSVNDFYYQGDVRAVGRYVHRVVFSLFEYHLKDKYRSIFIINQHSGIDDLDETLIPDIVIDQKEVFDIKLSNYSQTKKEEEVYTKYYEKVCCGYLVGDKKPFHEGEFTVCSLSGWIQSKSHYFERVDQLLQSVSNLEQEVGEGRYNDLYPVVVDLIIKTHKQGKKQKEISDIVKKEYGFDYSPRFISGILTRKYLRAYLTDQHHEYLNSVEKKQKELLLKKEERNKRIYDLVKIEKKNVKYILELMNKEYPKWPLKSRSSINAIVAIQDLHIAPEHMLDELQQEDLQSVIDHTFALDAKGLSSSYIALCTGKSTASVNGLLAGSRYPHLTKEYLNKRQERLEEEVEQVEKVRELIWQHYLNYKSQHGRGQIIEDVIRTLNEELGTSLGKREIEYAIFTHPEYEEHKKEESLKRAKVTKLVLETVINQRKTKGVEDLHEIQAVVEQTLNEKISTSTIRHYLIGRGVKKSTAYLPEIYQLLKEHGDGSPASSL